MNIHRETSSAQGLRTTPQDEAASNAQGPRTAPQNEAAAEGNTAPVLLPPTRVKDIARQDDSIGKISSTATSMIARCAEAFLTDLVKASMDRAWAAKDRTIDDHQRQRQLQEADVRRAADEEERFDFLRPVLAEHSSTSKIESCRGKRSGSTSAARPKRKVQRRMNSADSGHQCATAGEYAQSKLLAKTLSGQANVLRSRAHGDLSALGGLTDQEKRLLLTDNVHDSCSTGVLDDGREEDDDDYDNC